MKNLNLKSYSLLIGFSLILLNPVTAQVFNGDLILSSQDDVDNFTYTEVTGNLVIGQEASINTQLTDINDLGSLASLTIVGGSLSIQRTQLTDLAGLDLLTSVRSLNIVSNPSLENIQNLSSLSGINDDLIIAVCPLLINLSGLENISSLGGWLDIEGNNALESLQGLNNLQTIVGPAVIDECPQLTDLQGLENLESVRSSFRIGPDLSSLVNLMGLERLKNLSSLNISGNANLESLEGLNQLVLDNLTVRGNPKLTTLNGLESVGSLDIIIDGNTGLLSLEGLEHASSMDHLRIRGNQSLQNLKGLENLREVAVIFTIENNPSLTSLSDLASLEFVSILRIINNQQLVNLSGLESIQTLNFLTITDNENLSDCCALAELVGKVIGPPEINNNAAGCNQMFEILSTCGTSIAGFILADAVDNRVIRALNMDQVPEVINLRETGSVTILANFDQQAGSVEFMLDGQKARTENVIPYTLFGDNTFGFFFRGHLPLGRHTLTAIAYSQSNGGGEPLESMSIELMVINDIFAVTSFTLVNSEDNSDMLELTDGIQINGNNLNGVNVRANTYGEIGSVIFDVDNTIKFQVENVSPYAAGGDFPVGNYSNTPQLSEMGAHTITATPYSLPRGKGVAGTSLTVSYEITGTQTSPEPLNNQAFMDLSYYPNPVTHWLNVYRTSTAQPVNLILVDRLGVPIRQEQLTSDHAQFDLSDLPTGIYFIKVRSAVAFYTRKILVE